jgi:hypothetical protein
MRGTEGIKTPLITSRPKKNEVKNYWKYQTPRIFTNQKTIDMGGYIKKECILGTPREGGSR